MCSTPACQKPSWNRSPGEYCSRACRDGPQQAIVANSNGDYEIQFPMRLSEEVRRIPCRLKLRDIENITVTGTLLQSLGGNRGWSGPVDFLFKTDTLAPTMMWRLGVRDQSGKVRELGTCRHIRGSHTSLLENLVLGEGGEICLMIDLKIDPIDYSRWKNRQMVETLPAELLIPEDAQGVVKVSTTVEQHGVSIAAQPATPPPQYSMPQASLPAAANTIFNECLLDDTWSPDDKYPSLNNLRLGRLTQMRPVVVRDVLEKRCTDGFKLFIDRLADIDRCEHNVIYRPLEDIIELNMLRHSELTGNLYLHQHVRPDVLRNILSDILSMLIGIEPASKNILSKCMLKILLSGSTGREVCTKPELELSGVLKALTEYAANFDTDSKWQSDFSKVRTGIKNNLSAKTEGANGPPTPSKGSKGSKC